MRRELKIITIKKALTQLKKINDEIRYTSVAEGRGFSSGIISFRPRKRADAKQIEHSDRDVLCQVLKGRGRLKVNGRRIALAPGTLCHIPKRTPHDFAAGKTGELVLFYSLIKTG
ncbi:MAG TPA: cupin domain-containing protein [Candidatus Binatia bacterium]|jgi:mannose-6-phosphate isomerase-like protein (cupin superfamily)